MFFFWRLLLAHLLADFTFQTDRIAQWKRENISGVIFHVLIFLFFAVAINYQYLPQKGFALALLAIAVTHVLQDQWRIYNVKKCTSVDNILLFIWDQFVHILIIFVLAPKDPPDALPEKWVLVLIIFVAAAQFSSIFIYFLKKLFSDTIAVMVREKYHGIVERLIIVACFIIPGRWYWIALPLAVLLVLGERIILKKSTNNLDFSAFNLIASNTIAVILSITARKVWY